MTIFAVLMAWSRRHRVVGPPPRVDRPAISHSRSHDPSKTGMERAIANLEPGSDRPSRPGWRAKTVALRITSLAPALPRVPFQEEVVANPQL
jgi:hypothetical protein